MLLMSFGELTYISVFFGKGVPLFGGNFVWGKRIKGNEIEKDGWKMESERCKKWEKVRKLCDELSVDLSKKQEKNDTFKGGADN